MRKYLIYYITTGTYINYADDFFSTLSNFMPGDEKHILWLSDNFLDITLPEGVSIIKRVNIIDMPWPLVTLQKMHFCLNNKLSGYDGYFYFNADATILEMTPTCINEIKEALDNNLFICTWHGGSYEYLSCVLENKTTNYKQANFFGGSEYQFYSVCTDVVNSINLMLSHNMIPEWHDETVLNSVLNNYELLFRPFVITPPAITNFEFKFKECKEKSPYLFIITQRNMKYKAKKAKY